MAPITRRGGWPEERRDHCSASSYRRNRDQVLRQPQPLLPSDRREARPQPAPQISAEPELDSACMRSAYMRDTEDHHGTDRERRTLDDRLPLRPVEFHILLSLAAGERHGYGIIQDILERGDAPVPDVGTMYRALARMVEAGLIEAAARRPAPTPTTNGATTTASPRQVASCDCGSAAAGGSDARGAAGRPAAEGSQVMTSERLLTLSERWFRLLERFYPPDFRDDCGDAVVETYRDRARDALRRGGILRLALVWMSALVDSLRNGPGERVRPAVSWRRNGNWGRDAEMATRRLLRARAFAAATICTLTIGLGMVARRLHRRLQDPDRADAVPGCRCAVLRMARLWADRRRQAGRAGRARFHGAAEVRRRGRGRRGAPADARRHLRAARGCRPERDRGDGRHAKSLRAARRDAHARTRLCAE